MKYTKYSIVIAALALTLVSGAPARADESPWYPAASLPGSVRALAFQPGYPTEAACKKAIAGKEFKATYEAVTKHIGSILGVTFPPAKCVQEEEHKVDPATPPREDPA